MEAFFTSRLSKQTPRYNGWIDCLASQFLPKVTKIQRIKKNATL
jgi:hypothetical protein